MKQPTILVTGGAGYIASACILKLTQCGYYVVAIDRKQAHLKHDRIDHVISDYADTEILKKICAQYNIIACMHFAAYIEVGESVKDPLKYYENNVSKSISLLQTLIKAGIKNYIFSSSCAVYGTPQFLPLTEDHPRNPISPYGMTKHMIELMLEDCARAYGIRYAILRYFNAAGALPEFGIGEQHEPETHLIPRALHATLHEEPFTIFGNDHATVDGTCVRDYVHIADLADAHLRAVEYLLTNNSIVCNLGTGAGVTVEQVLRSIEQITNKRIKRIYADKRPGDPATLIARVERAQKLLHWTAQYSTLDHIIATAYEWQRRRYLYEPKRTDFTHTCT